MPTITHKTPALTRAMLITYFEDGHTITWDGKPDSAVADYSMNVPPMDLTQEAVLSGQPFPLPTSRLEFRGVWSNPMCQMAQAITTWRGRFKRWLKAFPTS